MARPRKHHSDKDRKEAAKEAKQRYIQKKKEGVAIRSKRLGTRRDVQLIRDMPMSAIWSIHFRRQFTAPPLPTDLLEDYSLDARWIRGKFTGSEHFQTVFDRNAKPIASMGWWLEYPPVAEPTFEPILESYTIDAIIDYLDGWNLRYILDSFTDWWKGAHSKGRERRSYLTEVAASMLTRMSMILDELCEMESWINTHAKDTSVDRLSALAYRFRYWRYQELTLIRSELWWRYHQSIPGLFSEYKEKKMDWQVCWFEMPLVDAVRSRVLQTLDRGHVIPQEDECDHSGTSPPQLDDQMDSDSDEDDEDPNG